MGAAQNWQRTCVKSLCIKLANLNHFQPMLPFYNPWKTCFLVFLGHRKWKHWPKMFLGIPSFCKLRREGNGNDNWPILSQCYTSIYPMKTSRNQMFSEGTEKAYWLKMGKKYSSFKCFSNLCSLCWLFKTIFTEFRSGSMAG